MKHITKSVFILLALCMIAGLLPWMAVPVLAATENATIDGITYTLDTAANTALVAGLAEGNTATALTIPETVTNGSKTYNITGIANEAFAGKTAITSVTIPNSVLEIGAYAFNGCTGLTTIDFGSGVETIGSSAFYGCSNLSILILPPSVTSIGASAFQGCSNLSILIHPPSVTTIGAHAFEDCGSADHPIDVDLSAVTSLGGNAFAGCKLRKVTLGATALGQVNGVTFGGATINELIIVGNGTNSVIPNEAFRNVSSLGTVEISGVKSIGSYAFAYCTSLTTFDFGRDVTSIGDHAFNGCTGLTTIDLPPSVTTIGAYAFNGCTDLTTIDFGSDVTNIGNNAFHGCTGLTTIDLPASVTNIGAHAFEGCGSADHPMNVDLSAVPSLTSLGDYAFCDSKLDTVTLGAAALGKIKSNTFSGSTINKLVIVGNGTDSAIPNRAFQNVSSLGTIEIFKENTKPAATITKAPEGKDLTANGEAQELVTAGEASGGTMEYGVSIITPTTWSTSIPTESAAGTYTVWYRAKGDAEHSNSKPQSIVVTVKYGADTMVYNGEEQDLVIGGSAEGGTMLYALGTDDKTAPSTGWSETIPTGKDVGVYYVWYKVEGDENHNGVDPVCIKVTIVPDSQVSQFEEGVKTLPTDVTRDDEELVDALRKMYDSLTDDQKKQIPDEDVKKLLDAEKKIEELKGADQGVADGVSNLIDQLPDVENVKEENRTTVEAVAKQYDALTDKQKEMIPKTERDKLEALRKALETNPEDEAVAAQFTSDVDALLGSKAGTTKSLLDAATAILNTMTDKQKALIDPETMALYNEAIEAFKPGRNFRSGNDYFKVLSNGDVTYHHPASTNITDVTVPNQVKKGKFFFKVIKVSNNAFRDCNNLQWAIIGKNVYVLGEKIFYNTPALTKVNVLGNGIVSGKVTDAFLRDGNLTVKVPSDKLDEYKALFIGEGGLNGKVKAA